MMAWPDRSSKKQTQSTLVLSGLFPSGLILRVSARLPVELKAVAGRPQDIAMRHETHPTYPYAKSQMVPVGRNGRTSSFELTLTGLNIVNGRRVAAQVRTFDNLSRELY